MTVNFDLRGFKTHLRSNFNELQAPGLHIIQYYIIYKTDYSNNKKLQKSFTKRTLYTVWEGES